MHRQGVSVVCWSNAIQPFINSVCGRCWKLLVSIFWRLLSWQRCSFFSYWNASTVFFRTSLIFPSKSTFMMTIQLISKSCFQFHSQSTSISILFPIFFQLLYLHLLILIIIILVAKYLFFLFLFRYYYFCKLLSIF